MFNKFERSEELMKYQMRKDERRENWCLCKFGWRGLMWNV